MNDPSPPRRTSRAGFGPGWYGAVCGAIPIAALTVAASAANACPVCFSANDESVLRTYYMTAAMLTVLPLIMLAAIGGWLYKKSTRPTPAGDFPRPEGSVPTETRR